MIFDNDIFLKAITESEGIWKLYQNFWIAPGRLEQQDDMAVSHDLERAL